MQTEKSLSSVPFRAEIFSGLKGTRQKNEKMQFCLEICKESRGEEEEKANDGTDFDLKNSKTNLRKKCDVVTVVSAEKSSKLA